MLYHCIGTKMMLSENSLLVFITTYIFDFMIYIFNTATNKLIYFTNSKYRGTLVESR